MPAPVIGSTVKLVRDGRCTVTSLPSGEELHFAPHVHLYENANVDDEAGVAGGEKAAASDAHEDEKPRLSWSLTLSLLVFVTIVRLSLQFLSFRFNILLACCHQCRVPGRIYG